MPEPNDDLQFNTAETTPGTAAPGTVCARCQKPLDGFYYEAVGQVFCSACKLALQAQFASGFKASNFIRAILFGAVGALGGALLYFAVVAATGYEIGLIAIVVGFMVGWMVNKGARGRGGRSFQALALVLTYLAVGSTYMGLAIKEMWSQKVVPSGEVTKPSAEAPSSAATDDSAKVTATKGANEKPLGLLMALGGLVLLMFAVPVMAIVGDLPGSLISGLIIGFALRQAWIMNRAISVEFKGPFKVAAT